MITVDELLASPHFVRDDDVPDRDHYRFHCHCRQSIKIEIDFYIDYGPSTDYVMLWFGDTGYLLPQIDTIAKLEQLAVLLKSEEA